MSVTEAVAAIATMSVEDRIRLVQDVWDSIPEDGHAPPDLSDAQKADLNRRLAELREHPERALTWEQIKARVTGRP